MISSLGNSLGIGSGFALLRRLQTIEEEFGTLESLASVEATVEAPAASRLAQTSGSSNSMSGNFFNANYEKSKYVKSTIESKQQESSYASKMTSIVSSLISQATIWDMQRKFGDKNHPIENTYVVGNRLTSASSKVMQQVEEEETAKESQKNLDEIKDNIEERAEEATMPKDENGKPIEDVTAEGVEKTTPESTSEPSSSDSTPSPVHEIPRAFTAEVSDSGDVVVMTGEPIPAVGKAQSIDIVV